MRIKLKVKSKFKLYSINNINTKYYVGYMSRLNIILLPLVKPIYMYLISCVEHVKNN